MTGVGKVVVFGAGEGQRVRLGPDRFVIKGGPRQRSDAFSVIEYEGAPGVPGPPPHVHRAFEEAWVILEGEVRFRAAGETVAAKKGTYLLVPRGTPHTFEVVGTTPARWIGIFAPGRYVSLLEELGEVLPAHGPPDPGAVVRLFAKYDTEIVDQA